MAAAVLSVHVAATLRAEEPPSLRILRGGYPRAFFFRSAEGLAASGQIPFGRWDACFSRLMGIEGKVLDEEVPGRALRNVDFFNRFKQLHPDQLVLLHYNGNARDPRYQTQNQKYFAGHWLYYNGAKILDDVPAESGETEIRLDNPTLFRLATGRYRNANEDLGLCMLDARGRPDWGHSEQVQLVAVNLGRKVIRVRRGCFGTTPRAFPAARAYAAAHVSEGPWGRRSHLMWFYNYSTRCPRDDRGHTCADVHADELAARFAPDGQLALFDGLEFDVLHYHAGRRSPGRGPDGDADGRMDNGVFDGRNEYGIGVVEFCRRLRRNMGPDRIIQADGASTHNQRAFQILNGIESEGFPHLSDWEMRDWSGGLNRYFFWQQNAHPPAFNYINHKFTASGRQPGQRVRPDVPFATHRLVLAAAMFTDSAVCYSFSPQAEAGELLGIWDELRQGTENRLGWLGQPRGPAVRLAQRQLDVLGGQGRPVAAELLRRLRGEGMKFEFDAGRLKVTATNDDRGELRFRLADVPCDGPDLFVSVTAEGRPMRGYPAEVARLTYVGIAPPEGQLVGTQLPPTGMCRRGKQETAIEAESGAAVRPVASQRLGGKTHNAYLVHPPYRGGTGYTFWRRDVSAPDGGRLEFFTGMSEIARRRSDGVTFRVLVAEIDDGKVGSYTQVFEHSQVADQWTPHRVPLSDFGGKTVRLKFVSDCGPNDNSTTDHSYWGDVVVLGAKGHDTPTSFPEQTQPVRYMSWLNDREFESGYYFREVKSKSIDLEWVIEGTEPVWITSVTAHQHPDAIYRRFEHGLVLANPSPRPYVFELSKLFPARAFRRLRGSSRQDPQTNDGSPVEGKLVLQPREGLFLVDD